jgi:hypothetical protein
MFGGMAMELEGGVLYVRVYVYGRSSSYAKFYSPRSS